MVKCSKIGVLEVFGGETMELIEKRDALIEAFRQDPLWRHIESMGLQEKVFQNTSFFEQLIFGYDYSTSQLTEMLALKSNQQILNLLNRHDLKDYVRLTQSGNGYYKFNHIGAFQLHLILFLREEGMQPLDIATLIGTVTQYSKGRPQNREVINESSLSTSDEVKQLVEKEVREQLGEYKSAVQRGLMKVEEKQKNEITRLEQKNQKEMNRLKHENQLALWEAEARSVANQIETIEKQIRMIDNQTQTKVGVMAKLLGLHNSESNLQLGTIRTELEGDKTKLVMSKTKLDKAKQELIADNKKLIATADTDTLGVEE